MATWQVISFFNPWDDDVGNCQFQGAIRFSLNFYATQFLSINFVCPQTYSFRVARNFQPSSNFKPLPNIEQLFFGHFKSRNLFLIFGAGIWQVSDLPHTL